MKLLVLYHPNSESARSIEEYIDDLKRQYHTVKLELISLETREGAATASLYDIVRYPALLVTDDIGRPLRDWQGENLPLKDEVISYLAS